MFSLGRLINVQLEEIIVPKPLLLFLAACLAAPLINASPASASCAVPNTLTNGQVADATQVMGNFEALGNCAVSVAGPSQTGSLTAIAGSTSIGVADLTGDVSTAGTTATTLAPSGVIPGAYVSANITVDAKGRITEAQNGSGPNGSLTLISRQILASNTASVSFSSIPSDFEDLVVVAQGRATAPLGTVSILVRFNNDSGPNYDYSRVNRWGSINMVGQTSADFANFPGANADAGRATDFTFEVINYKRNSFFKSGHSNSGVSQGTTTTLQAVEHSSLVWRSTAAINQITIFPMSGVFATGTVFSLYARQ